MKHLYLLLLFYFPLYSNTNDIQAEYLIRLNTNEILYILAGLLIIIITSILYFNRKIRKILLDSTKKQNMLLELFDKGDVVLFKWNNDKGYSVDYVSKNVYELLEYTQDEFLNNHILFDNCILKEDEKRVDEELENFKKDKKSFFRHKPYRVVTKSKKIKWILDSTIIVRDAHGKIINYLGHIVDVSEQIEIQEKLKESERRWKFAVDGNGDGLWDWNINTKKVFFSKTWKKLLGFEDDELENTIESWENRIHPNDLEDVKKAVSKHIKNETLQYKLEYRLLCKDGNYKWFLDRGIVVEKDENNNPIRMIGTHSDIDQNKKLIRRVEALKFRFESMFMNHDAIMLLINPDNGKIIDANYSAQKFYGYTHEDFVSMSINDINSLNNEDTKKKRLEAKKNKHNSFKFIHKTKIGEEKIVDVNSSPIETDEGIILFSIIKDVTKEKEIEKKFLKERDFINNIFEDANAIFSVIDSSGRMIKLNKYGRDFSGYSFETLSKEPYCWDILIPNEMREKVRSIIKKAIEGKSFEHVENGWISKTGERKLFEWSNTLVKKEDGSVDYIASIGIDITDKKLLESQSKLVSMGEMIGNIAHQWRQPLSVITTSISGLKLKSELTDVEKEDIDDCVENVIKQSKYLSKTIDSFRDFIKGDKSYKQISIKETILNSLALVEATLKNNYVNVILDINDDIKINGNTTELSEGFINILNNSKDILKANVEKETDRLLFITTKKVDNKLALKILDSGGGINENYIERIFEPYFTTKHQSQGTGLGLSMADKIIRERHKAKITAYNEKYEYQNKTYIGACFYIVFS